MGWAAFSAEIVPWRDFTGGSGTDCRTQRHGENSSGAISSESNVDSTLVRVGLGFPESAGAESCEPRAECIWKNRGHNLGANYDRTSGRGPERSRRGIHCIFGDTVVSTPKVHDFRRKLFKIRVRGPLGCQRQWRPAVVTRCSAGTAITQIPGTSPEVECSDWFYKVSPGPEGWNPAFRGGVSTVSGPRSKGQILESENANGPLSISTYRIQVQAM